ncbi:hypothetical protein GCM10009122_08980 [Fulvivirga kasyanovii]|uniref:Glycosyltransferase n=1 Tax=Fulvivirga kasyanovii TaxID=396812 RepID=A0ABW9RZ41_9BACT|nr:glycosyltransferase family 4 protein [Fulvivirga kasyanovii]MTI29095.1 glycosyltransferase [Fulvivirga kasyanovii]
MEIIHLILGKANPERMNGVNKVVYQLATRQAAAGKKVAVWGITKKTDHNYGERIFTTELFQARRNPFKVDKSLKAAIKQKKDKAVFHLHGGWIPAYAPLSAWFHKHQIPFVLTPHGAYNTVAMQRSPWMKKLYFRFFEKKLLDRAHRVHSIGESEVDGLESIYPNTKSFLLPYGFVAPDSPQKPKTDDEFIIGFVGRLDIYTKGLDLIIDAFAEFQQKNRQAKLWIVGDSNEKEVLVKMIDRKNLKHVTLWGSKYGNDKDELMRQMHVFVHPSRNEGLPSAVLEACSMGIPAIVSRATNVGNYITSFKSGYCINNENPAALTDALQKLYYKQQAGQISSLSANARAMVREVFDWNTLVEKFDTLYRLA